MTTVVTAAGPGTVDVTAPARPRATVLLTHGSAGGVDAADLLAVRDALVAVGFAVGLLTQPYRVAGRRTPPKPEVQDVAFLELVAAARCGGPLILGGRSNGARLACRTAVAANAAGVVALAFPLHPPGRPEKTRIAELDGAGVPVLVVQGERDPFGRPPDGPGRTVHVVPGDHALTRDHQLIAGTVVDFVTSIIGRARVGE